MARWRTRLRDRKRRTVGEGHEMSRWYHQRTGWVPPSRKQIASKPTLSQSYRRKRDRQVDTFLWRLLWTAMEENEGPTRPKTWVPQNQSRGTCIGQTWKLGCDTVMSLSYLLFGTEFPGRASVATIYAGSRVEVAGLPGFWDGSNGYWAAEFVTKWGVTTLLELGMDDNARLEDERLAVRWAGSRDGVPASFEEMAEQRPILQTPRITTVEEAITAVTGGAPISIASNLIPSGKIDKNGVSRVRRDGGHNVLLWGLRWISGEPTFLYQNSWGNWADQVLEDQPAGSVWINAYDLQKTLDQNDSHALVGIGGLEYSPSYWL